MPSTINDSCIFGILMTSFKSDVESAMWYVVGHPEGVTYDPLKMARFNETFQRMLTEAGLQVSALDIKRTDLVLPNLTLSGLE
jgi:hypothetical protein